MEAQNLSRNHFKEKNGFKKRVSLVLKKKKKKNMVFHLFRAKHLNSLVWKRECFENGGFEKCPFRGLLRN